MTRQQRVCVKCGTRYTDPVVPIGAVGKCPKCHPAAMFTKGRAVRMARAARRSSATGGARP